ncbi:MAG: hypothetical protein E3K37_03825 [Candidatus Kuenenia sp.]|nr:hypothetical protein [Candidatus Kuenenia hertensis]
MKQKANRRRIYIIDRNFQYGFIRKISILAILIVIGSLFFFAMVYRFYGDVNVKITQPVLFKVTEKARIVEDSNMYTVFEVLWPVLTICVLATLLSIFFFGVIVSHRMAGPIYRMRKILSEMSKYNLGVSVGDLRKNDEFKSLLSEINNLKERWNEPIQELQGLCKELDDETKKKNCVNRICEIISAFKIKNGTST